jgi:hypothetical protein
VLESFGFAVLMALVGTAVAALWTWVMGLAGAPGGRLSILGMRHSRGGLVLLGAVLTLLAQTYLALAFTGAVARWVSGHQGFHPLRPVWPLWLVGWYLGSAPALFAARDRAKAMAHHVRPRLATATLYVAVVAFWLFVRWPGLFERGWSWVPELPR